MEGLKVKEEQEVETVDYDVEDRIDQAAISMFGALGYKGRLPDKLVQTYNEFKRVKDRIQPGRLTAEGYAFVIVLSGV